MKLGRRLAFDVGKARIGVALSDAAGILASPLPYITRSEDDAQTISDMMALANQNEVNNIYFGLPISLSGSGTESSRDAEFLAQRFADLFPGQVFLVDERLTTVSAASKLRDSGRSARSSKGLIDSASAVEILEFALQSERSSGVVQGLPVRRSNGS